MSTFRGRAAVASAIASVDVASVDASVPGSNSTSHSPGKNAPCTHTRMDACSDDHRLLSFFFFSFSFIPANNSDADGSVAHRPDPRKLETQCVPAVGECRLKKRRRTGGSDSTFDEARDITFEEEDDSPDDVSDEPQDTLCTLCGVFFCEEENGACDHCRTYSPDNSESPFNLSECAVVADLLEGKGDILYVENTLEDSLKAYDRNDAEVTVREEDTRDPQKLWGNNAAEYLSKIRKSCYVRASREFVWYELQAVQTDGNRRRSKRDCRRHFHP